MVAAGVAPRSFATPCASAGPSVPRRWHGRGWRGALVICYPLCERGPVCAETLAWTRLAWRLGLLPVPCACSGPSVPRRWHGRGWNGASVLCYPLCERGPVCTETLVRSWPAWRLGPRKVHGRPWAWMYRSVGAFEACAVTMPVWVYAAHRQGRGGRRRAGAQYLATQRWIPRMPKRWRGKKQHTDAPSAVCHITPYYLSCVNTTSCNTKTQRTGTNLMCAKGDGKVWFGTVGTSQSAHAHTGSLAVLSQEPNTRFYFFPPTTLETFTPAEPGQSLFTNLKNLQSVTMISCLSVPQRFRIDNKQHHTERATCCCAGLLSCTQRSRVSTVVAYTVHHDLVPWPDDDVARAEESKSYQKHSETSKHHILQPQSTI